MVMTWLKPNPEHICTLEGKTRVQICLCARGALPANVVIALLLTYIYIKKKNCSELFESSLGVETKSKMPTFSFVNTSQIIVREHFQRNARSAKRASTLSVPSSTLQRGKIDLSPSMRKCLSMARVTRSSVAVTWRAAARWTRCYSLRRRL